MKSKPSHTLNVAAKILEERGSNHELIEDVYRISRALNRRRFEKQSAEDTRRQERHRTLMQMLPDTAATEKLKLAMLQRAYDLLWDGDANGCDALLEFLPDKEAIAMLDCWSDDQEAAADAPKSHWYG